MTPRQVLQSADIEIAKADRLLEVAQAAKRLQRCPEQVRRYIRAGELKAVRSQTGTRGGNYRIPESELIRFLQLLTT